jgi:hypothetical protein
MSTPKTDLYTKNTFYTKIKDRDEVSRFRVSVTDPDKGDSRDEKTDTCWTFMPYKRRPRHHQTKLSEAM